MNVNMKFKEKIFYYLASHFKKPRFQRFFEKKLARACGDSANGGFAYSYPIRKFYNEHHGLEIGYGTFGGCWLNPNLFWKNIKIGNYCSFANELSVYTANHPMSMYTTHPVAYDANYGAPNNDNDIVPNELIIGHGVWVGQRSLILPGCHVIGNGAIVGGGSVVTKDVPPYAIVAGNPAKIIRYRLEKEVIEKLETTRWWEHNKEELIDIASSLNALVTEDV